MYYTDTVTIPNYLCDCRDTLTMWGLARLLQESAGHHAETAQMGFRQLIERGKAWVLCRMYYEVNRLPMEGETVTVRTWSRGTDGLFAFREFQLLDDKGVAATCSTYWVIIDMATRKAVRIRDYWAGIDTHADCATSRESLDRLRIPRDVGEAVTMAQFPVKPSMLDHTFHVNNAEYIKWVFDNLPPTEAMPGKAAESVQESHLWQYPGMNPFRFAIEFLTETQPTESVQVDAYGTPAEGGTCFFKITNTRTVAVVASFESVIAK